MNPTIFNRNLLRMRRDRSAENFAEVDFVKREMCERLADRLLDIDRNFPTVLDLGCHSGQLSSTLPAFKIGQLFEADYSFAMLPNDGNCVQADEEFLPFARHSFDAILSAGSLHWVNDLVGTLIQAKQALKPDGLLLAVLTGPRSLQQLREAMLHVANETGKASPRISPFVEVRDAGALLQRAGFALPVIDSEFITLTYRNFTTLLAELKAMGESNALTEQTKGLTTARYWQAVESAYPRNNDGLFEVTIELIFITAWSPHPSQQQPAKRGSGNVSLREVL